MCLYKRTKKYMGCVMLILISMFKKILISILNVKLWSLVCTLGLFTIVIFLWTKIDYSNAIYEHRNLEYSIISWWTPGFPGTSRTIQCTKDVNCEVVSDRKLFEKYNIEAYLFYGSNLDFDDLPLPRKPAEIIWGLYHEESPRNVAELLYEKMLSIFNFTATFSRHSDVPSPLQYLGNYEDIVDKKFYVETAEKNLQLKDIAPILYLQSDCETSTERDIYVKVLMKYIKIDSYGLCLNNKELPQKFKVDYLNKLDDDEFLRFVAKYKFVIAIENGVCNDYVTEKFWRAIKVGSVPIYFGSPTIRDWLPNYRSAILLQDYPSPELMKEHIEKLLNDDQLYETYLEHKINQTVSNKKIKEQFQYHPYQTTAKSVEEFECLICKRIYERKAGSTTQYVADKRHYDCPKPISALTLDVNPTNDWVYSWERAKKKADEIYHRVMSSY